MTSKRNTAGILIRRKLPSGKTIEVLRQPARTRAWAASTSAPSCPTPVEQAPADADELRPDALDQRAAGDADAAVASGPTDPHICPDCDSHLGYPIAWGASDENRWTADLCCPNCERNETTELDLVAADRFDEELEQGADMLLRDLKRLSEANMLDDLERLVAALSADVLLPMDF
jgi:hypothetical protein